MKNINWELGSLVTLPEHRNRGYGSQLNKLMTTTLLANRSCKAIYLHSDIDHNYYEKLGFAVIKGASCMCISNGLLIFEDSIPAYF